MRQTSIETFNKVKNSGLISKQRLRVYEILCRHNHTNYVGDGNGLTASEIEHLAKTVFLMGNSKHLHKRLSELERQGVIHVVGTRKCRRTHNNSMEWAITGDMPRKFERPISEGANRRDNKLKAVVLLREAWEEATGLTPLRLKIAAAADLIKII